jgi:hypothetical protein
VNYIDVQRHYSKKNILCALSAVVSLLINGNLMHAGLYPHIIIVYFYYDNDYDDDNNNNKF